MKPEEPQRASTPFSRPKRDPSMPPNGSDARGAGLRDWLVELAHDLVCKRVRVFIFVPSQILHTR